MKKSGSFHQIANFSESSPLSSPASLHCVRMIPMQNCANFLKLSTTLRPSGIFSLYLSMTTGQDSQMLASALPSLSQDQTRDSVSFPYHVVVISANRECRDWNCESSRRSDAYLSSRVGKTEQQSDIEGTCNICETYSLVRYGSIDHWETCGRLPPL